MRAKRFVNRFAIESESSTHWVGHTLWIVWSGFWRGKTATRHFKTQETNQHRKKALDEVDLYLLIQILIFFICWQRWRKSSRSASERAASERLTTGGHFVNTMYRENTLFVYVFGHMSGIAIWYYRCSHEVTHFYEIIKHHILSFSIEIMASEIRRKVRFSVENCSIVWHLFLFVLT